MDTSIANPLTDAVNELIERAHLHNGQLLVMGCSTSEIAGYNPGTHSGPQLGEEIAGTVMPILKAHGIFLAAQCCEHLNRALVVEEEALDRFHLLQVNAVPQPKAGGSFATAVYKAMERPVLAESVAADAGLDIGCVMIGMHLKRVAVPLRLATAFLGEAKLVAARTRPPFTGGERAVYDDLLK